MQRYMDPRVHAAVAEAEFRRLPLYFLSGRFGLIEAHRPIPWYDEALQPAAVEALIPRVVSALEATAATAVHFLALGRETPGWAPYWDVVEAACAELGVALKVL